MTNAQIGFYFIFVGIPGIFGTGVAIWHELFIRDGK